MIKVIKKIFKKKHKPEDTLYRVIDDLVDEKERMKNTIDLLRKQIQVETILIFLIHIYYINGLLEFVLYFHLLRKNIHILYK